MIISRLTKLGLLAVLLLALVAFSGCSDDVENFTPPPLAPLQSASADILMDNFVVCYTDMLLSDFEDILHEDFKMMFSEDTIHEWGLAPGATLDKAQILAIHDNMFSGKPGRESAGNEILPLFSIATILFERRDEWAIPAVEDPDFPGKLSAIYDVRMYFNDVSGTHAFYIVHPIAYFAEQVGDYWYLLGMNPFFQDQNKAVENATYDGVIYLYQDISEKTRD